MIEVLPVRHISPTLHGYMVRHENSAGEECRLVVGLPDDDHEANGCIVQDVILDGQPLVCPWCGFTGSIVDGEWQGG